MGMLRFTVALLVFVIGCAHASETPDPARDILVTFDNEAARSGSAGLSAPYQRRKRYSIAPSVQSDAAAIAKEHSLQEIEHWPIKSLSIYCFVYRLPEGVDREKLIATLNADARVESAQELRSFDTSFDPRQSYDDTYANLQYGLDIMNIAAAHGTTRGDGIRIVIIDSQVAKNHEDLHGRIDRVRDFSYKNVLRDEYHGTAVASVIGARSNNALGIVGIAPEATLDVFVSCWSGNTSESAICDSFSLSKALDAVLDDPPSVLNLSLKGPYDPLLERLIRKASEAGVVIVAAGPVGVGSERSFPSSMEQVIAVGVTPTDGSIERAAESVLLAPGNRILVAVPANHYDFRSGSSLAAAHVSGVAALILSITPDLSADTISAILRRSQQGNGGAAQSINACVALNLAAPDQRCVN